MKGREMDQASEKTLKKAITEAMESEDESLEYFKGMKYVDVTPEYIRESIARKEEEGRRKHRKRLLSAAAIFMVVLVTSSAAVLLMPGTDADAVRQRLQEQIAGWGDLLKDGKSAPSPQETEIINVSRTFLDWERIEEAKEFLPELFVPGYVPEGYELEKLTIQKTSDVVYTSIFLFRDLEDKELLIIQRFKNQEEPDNLVMNAISAMEIEQGTVYIIAEEHTKRLSGVLIGEKAAINVSSALPLDELQKVFEGLHQ